VTATEKTRGRVMIVDDDEIVLEVTRERLESAGWEVVLQHGSLGTAAAVLRMRPDYVLLDVSMPALSGDAIARYLTDRRPASTMIILYSARDMADLAPLAARCGAVGAVQKTNDRQAFLNQFERCVKTSAEMRG
jgi:DNA-binding NtrC family response regulator